MTGHDANEPTIERERRRLRLRVTAKLLLVLGFGATLYVALAAFLSGGGVHDDGPSMRVAIDEMLPGDTREVVWDGKPVLVHRRTAAEIEALDSSLHALADPDSARSRQPDWATGHLRSRHPEWFVAIAVGTDFSCPLEWRMASDELIGGAPWAGGYVDECRGSRYDPAGRVYADQFADRNLMVPPWRLLEGAVLLGG